MRSFWSFVNSLRNDNGLPLVMEYDCGTLECPQDIVDAFADHFQSCFRDYAGIILEPPAFDQLDCGISLHKHIFTT